MSVKRSASLPYDTGAPTLAPLYDLVSTTAYPEPTTRLAMSIDGVRQISEAGSDDALAFLLLIQALHDKLL
jgi:serine/threonine protein kinase HipA of HipAB toxin-antitoxin module